VAADPTVYEDEFHVEAAVKVTDERGVGIGEHEEDPAAIEERDVPSEPALVRLGETARMIGEALSPVQAFRVWRIEVDEVS
jgi:hypothetical protein